MVGHADLTVYIADDHDLVREGLRALVEGAGYTIVGMGRTAEDAVRDILQCQPSVAIIDVRLADDSRGVDVCRRQVSRQLP